MKARPILFAAPMVLALLDGRKTQTRRAVTLPPAPMHLGKWEPSTLGGPGVTDARGNAVAERVVIWHTRTGVAIGCPYGQLGDLLWLRETWAVGNWYKKYKPSELEPNSMKVAYAASDGVRGLKVRPSMFMPRWMSRITLRVTDVRVQRLQDISEEDALAEGALPINIKASVPGGIAGGGLTAKEQFSGIWKAINGVGAWDANPWVWCVSFEVARQNVDAYIAARAMAGPKVAA